MAVRRCERGVVKCLKERDGLKRHRDVLSQHQPSECPGAGATVDEEPSAIMLSPKKYVRSDFGSRVILLPLCIARVLPELVTLVAF